MKFRVTRKFIILGNNKILNFKIRKSDMNFLGHIMQKVVLKVIQITGDTEIR